MARLVVAILSAGLLLVGCTSTAAPSASRSDGSFPASIPPPVGSTVLPSPTASATALAHLPSATPMPTPTGTPPSTPAATKTPVAGSVPVLLGKGDFAVVTTTDLRLRTDPWTGADSTIDGGFLQSGTLVFVIGGPVESSGYWWYKVALVGQAAPNGATSGWVAAGDHREAWLRRQQPEAQGTYAWSGLGQGQPMATVHVTLGAGVYRMTFNGLARCGYRVAFGEHLEWQLGFEGSRLSTVQWDQRFPEPSDASEGAGDSGPSVTVFPPLPAGIYGLEVTDGGTIANPCPWQLGLTP